MLAPALAPAPRTVTSLIYRSEGTEKLLPSLFLSQARVKGGTGIKTQTALGRRVGMAW